METIRLTMAQAVVKWLIAQETVIYGETISLSCHQGMALVDFVESVNQLPADSRLPEEADRMRAGTS